MVTIIYDEDCEMMKIKNGNEVIFLGNYWDFDISPHGLKEFLESLNLEVKLTKTDKEMY